MTEPTTQQKEQFVKLYNKLHDRNETIRLFDTHRIDKKQVLNEIKTMKQHIKENNSFFVGLSKDSRKEIY